MSYGTFTPPPPRQFSRPTPTPPPSPPPAGINWDSRAWANGRKRNGSQEIPDAKFGHLDRDDQRIAYSHAGTGGPYLVDGAGNCQMNGDQSRIYYVVRNYNSVLFVTFIPNWRNTSDDLSLRMRSRHNEGGVNANRFGGWNWSIGPTSWDMKCEPYHNVHYDINHGSLPIRLVNGRIYKAKYQLSNLSPTSVQLLGSIDFGDGRGFVPVAKGIDSHPQPYMMDPRLYQQMSYYWTRNNGTGNIVVRDIAFQMLP